MLIHDIAGSVKESRKSRGWSQKELADQAGVGKTVIWDIEHLKDTVRLATLLKVLDALDMDLLLAQADVEAAAKSIVTATAVSTPQEPASDPEYIGGDELAVYLL